MKRLFIFMAAGVALSAPAFAQKVTVTAMQTSLPQANAAVTVCASEDANVQNVAGFQLTFTIPAGFQVALPDPAKPGDYTGAFRIGKAVPNGSAQAVNYDALANTLKVAITGATGVSGPGEIGCFDLTATAQAQPGSVTLTADLNDPDLNTVAVTTQPAALLGNFCTDTANNPGQVDVSDVAVTKGQTADVNVDVVVGSDAKPFSGADVTLTYDPAVLTPKAATGGGVTVTKGTVIPDAQIVANTAGTGKVRVALTGSKNSATSGTLFTVAFTLNSGQADGQSPLVLSASAFNDENEADVVNTIGDGAVRIGTGCAGQALRGDLNNDFSVDVADVVTQIRVIFGLETGATAVARADFDGNGATDIRDVRELLQYVVGIHS